MTQPLGVDYQVADAAGRKLAGTVAVIDIWRARTSAGQAADTAPADP